MEDPKVVLVHKTQITAKLSYDDVRTLIARELTKQTGYTVEQLMKHLIVEMEPRGHYFGVLVARTTIDHTSTETT